MYYLRDKKLSKTEKHKTKEQVKDLIEILAQLFQLVHAYLQKKDLLCLDVIVISSFSL